MNYLVTLLFPTTARAEARTIAEAITGVSHASAFAAGQDYTGGTASRVPVHLSVNAQQLKYARALAMQSLNCSMIIRDANWKVIESDIAEIAVDATVRDNAIQTALQTTFTESPDIPVASDSVTIFDVPFYVKNPADPLPGFIDPAESSVFLAPDGSVVTLALRDDGGTYYGAEVKRTEPKGYGTHRFSTAGRVNNLVTNPTFGCFNYASDADGGINPYEEGGFEIGGIVNGDTVHMYHFRDDTLAVNVVNIFDPGSAMIFHWEYTWTADRITWKCFSRDNVLIAQASSTTGVDDFIGATWRFNAWAFTGTPSAEVRLSFFDYSFTPA